jgi:hypothetical protein
MCLPYNDRSALLLKIVLWHRLTLAPTPGQYQALVAHVTDSRPSTVHSGSAHLSQKTQTMALVNKRFTIRNGFFR